MTKSRKARAELHTRILAKYTPANPVTRQETLVLCLQAACIDGSVNGWVVRRRREWWIKPPTWAKCLERPMSYTTRREALQRLSEAIDAQVDKSRREIKS